MIIWDNSLSGIYRNTEKEKQLLQSYLKRLGSATIKLYTLNNSFILAGTFIVHEGRSKELEEKLNGLAYDGGTDYSKIKLQEGDETILFSDGISTLSDRNKIVTSHPVYTISSSPKTDYTSLKSIAEETGGAFIDLQVNSIEEATERLLKQTLQFLGIKGNKTITEHYPNSPMSVQNGFSMAGKLSASASTVTLQFGYGKRIAFEKTVHLNYDEYETEKWTSAGCLHKRKLKNWKKLTRKIKMKFWH